MLTIHDIDRMSGELGEGWGHAHIKRVLALAEIIGAAVSHDHEVLTWAIYLHDWGAFPQYRQPGIAHALRSRQIVETEILPQTQFTDSQKTILLETIEKHDYQDQSSVASTEALLLREADWLDMLGPVGIIRDFAWGPNNLQVCYDRVLKHRDMIQNRFTLPSAKQIAAQRIEKMDLILNQIMADSFSYL